MIVGESQGVREQVSRWIEDGQNHYLGAMSRILQDFDRLQAAVESAERENEQLRNRVESSEHESEQLREEVKHLRAGTERHLREREEIADALTRVMNETITRLRTQTQAA